MAVDLRAAPPVVYEIFPRSFLDTTGSGHGDLKGVLEGLHHVRDLGVDAVWLAPFYPSPLHDAGYDISDHRAVDPALGTLDDFDAIVARAGEMGLGVVVDMVFNHTSDAHPTFQAALDGDDDAAAQYVFRDPKPDGSPPNNWMSFFGGPAWYWSHQRQQYYLHQFTERQPSLNLRHGPVQDDLRRTLKFWAARGVAGFRFDVVTAYLFDPSLKDNPPAAPEVARRVEGPSPSPYAYQDHVHDLLPGDGAKFAEMLRDWAGETMWLVGECNTGNQSLQIAQDFSAPGRLDATYTTDTVEAAHRPALIEEIFDTIPRDRWVLPWWWSSHDQRRPSAIDGAPPDRMPRFLGTLHCLLPGPLILYQGEELGLPHPHLERDEITDPFELRFWPDGPGRPGARVPLPWTEGGPVFGFTSGTPHLPMRWPEGLSIAEQSGDEASVLHHYRRMLSLRRAEGFATATDHAVTRDGDLLTIEVTGRSGRFRGTFNFGSAPCAVPIDGQAVLGTNPDATDELPSFAARIEKL